MSSISRCIKNIVDGSKYDLKLGFEEKLGTLLKSNKKKWFVL